MLRRGGNGLVGRSKKRENEIVTMLSDWIKIDSVYDEDTISEKDNKPFCDIMHVVVEFKDK